MFQSYENADYIFNACFADQVYCAITAWHLSSFAISSK
jgi:hypothetical protein